LQEVVEMRKKIVRLREIAAITVGGIAAFSLFATMVVMHFAERTVSWSLRILLLPFVITASLLYPERTPLRWRIARDVREWIRLTEMS